MSIMQDPVDEASRLREENAALRAALEARLDKLDAAQKEAFYAQHADLATRGDKLGVSIPQLEGAPPSPKKKTRRSAPAAAAAAAAPKAAAKTAPETPPEPTSVAQPKTAPVPPAADTKDVFEDDGVAAVLEVESDNTLVFKFSTGELLIRYQEL